MEKRIPHYDLGPIKALVADPKSQPFTLTAIVGAAELGLTPEEMREVILTLSPKNFHKSMTTYADSHVWQDVYHGIAQHGDPIYIKITGYADRRPPVIQFKAK
jgi:motility quorum-sensing regulator / GCU-specific mRNA interferase toxin